jgi:hypothetical protein
MRKILKEVMFVFVAFLLTIGFTACKNDENKPPESGLIKETTPMFDSLKGEWSWFITYYGYGVKKDNEFTSIVKILSQNKDSSINYEVIVEDTLFSKGNFKLQRTNELIPYYDFANIKLPYDEYHPFYKVEEWAVFFIDLEEKNILTFWDGVFDGYFYHYRRTK